MNLYEKRLSRVRTAMHENGLDTLILTPGAAMRYLSGFSEPGSRFLALVVPDDQPWLFVTPALNAGQARQNPAEVSDVRIWDDAQGWETLLATLSKDLMLDIGIVGLDDDMPARFALKIQELMPTATAEAGGVGAGDAAGNQGRFGTGRLAARGGRDGRSHSRRLRGVPGRGERDGGQPRHRAEHCARRLSGLVLAHHRGGAERGVAAPQHGPHEGEARRRRHSGLRRDGGRLPRRHHPHRCRRRGVGRGPARLRCRLPRASGGRRRRSKPGATAHDVDAAARSVIADAGYGEFFIHRTGHGIGLDDHEAPYMLSGNYTKLLPGHCFSVEPGVYLPGKFGVRLENILTVKDDGAAHVFNEAIPPELLVL